MRRKVYGQSKVEQCPFCDKTALSVNSQGIPVCQDHKKEHLNIKCLCGSWLDVKKSKWGPFFVCGNCGPVSLKKGLEIASMGGKVAYKVQKSSAKDPLPDKSEPRPKEMTVRSDELDFI
jgi:hypothetical protein